MFRKLREALKKQRYRVHSDDVALPDVHTGQDEGRACRGCPQTGCHRGFGPHQSPSVTASPDGEAFLYNKTPLTERSGAFCP